MEQNKYPKTFKELFEGTGIEPTVDADGTEHYNFKACKVEQFEGEFKKRYFTPDIEDIRVGYECEVYTYDNLTAPNPIKSWKRVTAQEDFFHEMVFPGIEYVRVPYLTKEQIEKEGWKKDEFWKSETKFEKKIDDKSYYSLTLNEGNQIVITKVFTDGWAWVWQPFYSGECKDINTFRYICKLLNIN